MDATTNNNNKISSKLLADIIKDGRFAIPDGLVAKGDLWLNGRTGLITLPKNLSVEGRLWLGDCTGLTTLPAGLSVGDDLFLGGCTGLTTLPKNLSVGRDLNLHGCTGLITLPKDLSVKGRILGREDLQRPRVREPHHQGTLETPNRTHDHRTF